MILNIQVIADLFFLALAMAYGAGALALPDAMFGNPWEPKVYPLIIAVGMASLSVTLLISELKKQKAGKAEGKVSFRLGDEGKLVAYVSVACVLYAIVFDPLGYVISTFLFIEAIMLYISKAKKMLAPTLWALGFSVGIYYLFGKVLAITLPRMPFLNL